MRPAALSRPARLLPRLLLVLGGVLTCGVLGVAFVVDRFGQRERGGAVDAVVVLGARVLPGGEPSGALRARVEQAVALHRRGLAPRLVFSGGVGVHPPAEARVMLRLAVALGVPASACFLEERSHSTEQNARYSAELLRELGARRVGVVSDPYHLLRARQYFRLHGFEVGTSPALLTERNLHLLDRVYWTVREAFALLLHPRVLFARAPEGAPATPGR
jgi:uncharacterized SAM-binding protein YcdF (DUF218 family)